jgi:glycosyltransferase involved in cell wall biosynthesis
MSVVTIIGSISQSPFIQNDVDLLQKYHDVYTVNIIGSLSKSTLPKLIQYIKLGYTTIFDVIPKICISDVTYIWFADIHAVIPIITCKLLHKKSIIAIGGYEISNMPEINYGMMREPLGFRSKICKWVMRNADTCIVPSMSYYFKAIPFCNNVIYVPNCLPIDKNVNIPNKQNIVLMVGLATKDGYQLKGIPLYNEVASRINTTASFYLIGPYDEEIKRKYHNIYYLGTMPHDMVLQRMKSSIIYCQLSETESFGVSVLESMINGCIPIVTKVDDLPLLINNNGISVDNNIDSVTSAIETSLKSSTPAIHKRIQDNAYEINNDYYNKRSYIFNNIIGDIK